jgi:hypothetical protein
MLKGQMNGWEAVISLKYGLSQMELAFARTGP